jgi:hypothetical protein
MTMQGRCISINMRVVNEDAKIARRYD